MSEAMTLRPSGQEAAETPTPVPALPADAVIIVPVRNTVLFPGVVIPVAIGRTRSIAAAQQAVREQRPIGVVMQRNPEATDPLPIDMHRMGTIANVARYITAPDGSHHLICQGEQRFQIVEFLNGWPFLVARVLRIPEPGAPTPQIEARFIHLKGQAIEAVQLLPQAPARTARGDPGRSSAAAARRHGRRPIWTRRRTRSRRSSRPSTSPRGWTGSRACSRTGSRCCACRQEIGRETKAAIDSRNREVLLREQMAAIQRQLGEGDEGKAAEIAELDKAIAKAGMPKEVEDQARKELRRLQRMPEAAGEYGMVRTYLDWLIELPWALPEEKPIDIAEARRILDDDHFGLEKIKRRIVEFLAVRKLAPNGKAPILCFVGPPGVGKTSLGQSIARAMGRKFVRVSLGGVHDEAEIRGHRRTYIGALPGNIIQAIRKAGARNCVMMLDEIDKLGAGIQGDPGAAMLEVLDPEQNNTFRDNYLAVPFDLSRVVVHRHREHARHHPRAAARPHGDHQPRRLHGEREARDRAALSGAPRQMEANGLQPGQVAIDDAALRDIIAGYTREAGVRGLEREIGQVLRHAAVRIAEGRADRSAIARRRSRRHPRRADLRERGRACAPACRASPPVSPGRRSAATSCSSRRPRNPGHGRLILTGQLGDVMKESAQAALSIVKNRAVGLGIDPGRFEKTDIHVHVPAGATPKDGPSAGVAMFMALVSLMTDRTLRSDTAMTGEISLRGLVLPVGGIKEKVVAAHARRDQAGACFPRATAGTTRTSRRRPASSWNSSGWSGWTTRWPRPSTRRRIRPVPRRRSARSPKQAAERRRRSIAGRGDPRHYDATSRPLSGEAARSSVRRRRLSRSGAILNPPLSPRACGEETRCSRSISPSASPRSCSPSASAGCSCSAVSPSITPPTAPGT